MEKTFWRLLNICVNTYNITPVTKTSKFNMKESDYYPAGAWNDPDAPYNWHEQPEIELEVTVSLTISKTVKVYTTDYAVDVEEDYEDGTCYKSYNFDDCDLQELVQEQIELPHELAKDLKEKKYLTDSQKELMLKDCSGWTVDDVCCNLENYSE
jgi:hypothetical protein